MAFPTTNETEQIIGYRLWKLVESAEGMPVLYSVVQDYVWLPFEPAQPGPAQSSPDPGNHSGVYAHKDVDKIWEYYDPGERGRTVAGAVNLWGTVIEHDAGYRAEFAYPKELWMPDDADPALIMRLEETYGVPVTLKENFPVAPPPPPPMQFKPAGRSIVGIMEVAKDVVYDRMPLMGETTHLFTRPLGSSVQHPLRGVYSVDVRHTNMVMSSQLPAPCRFLIQGLRCAFFELDGSVVPITDPIYWESTIELMICMKRYWLSPAAHIAEPALLFAATDWSVMPAAVRLDLINKLAHRITGWISPGIAGDNLGAGELDGVLIEQQMPFSAKVRVNFEKLEKLVGREVSFTLEGIQGRAVI